MKNKLIILLTLISFLAITLSVPTSVEAKRYRYTKKNYNNPGLWQKLFDFFNGSTQNSNTK